MKVQCERTVKAEGYPIHAVCYVSFANEIETSWTSDLWIQRYMNSFFAVVSFLLSNFSDELLLKNVDISETLHGLKCHYLLCWSDGMLLVGNTHFQVS